MAMNPHSGTDNSPKDVEVAYILFNFPWEHYLERVGCAVTDEYYRFRPLTHRSQQDSLRYLSNSLLTLLGKEAESFQRVSIYLVQLDDSVDNDALISQMEHLRRETASRGKQLEFVVIPHETIRPLVEIELARRSPHRSPNKIHELVIYWILQRTGSHYLYISDIDTVYFRSGFLAHCRDLTGRGYLACAYLDKGWGAAAGDEGRPERMHTVSMFFDVAGMRERFELQREMELIADFDARAALLAPGKGRDYFLTHRCSDTLSFFTYTLQHGFERNLLASLCEHARFYFEDAMLVMGNEYMFHAKYFHDAALRLLYENYQRCQECEQEVRRALNLLACLA